MPNGAPPERRVCVVMHDVAPATLANCHRLLAALAEVAPAPATLLLVPEYYRGAAARRDAGFCRLMDERYALGDELALHGFRHHDDVALAGPWDRLRRTVYTAAEGEFARLGEEEATRRIEAGLEWFAQWGWPSHGFVAPAWLMSGGTRRALARLPVRYTSSLTHIIDLECGTSHAAPSLVYSARAPWRRAVSQRWLEVAARLTDGAAVVRLGLHPVDAEHPAVVRHWQRLFERMLASRLPATKVAALEMLRGRTARAPQMTQTETIPTSAPNRAPASTSLG